MNRTAIFTISSNNYLHFGNTLLESVNVFHPEADLYYLLVDEPNDEEVYTKQNIYKLCASKDLDIPDYNKMAFAYTIVEFNTALKPHFINYLFEKGYEKVLYLDPDIQVYSHMHVALNILDDHSIIVTPHQLSPLGKVHDFKPYMEWEQSALETGIFNLGFIGVANNEEGRSFIDWWCNRCNYFCYVEPEIGLFVDQKWINLALCYFPSLYVLRHKGYNMAVWNLHERRLVGSYVNGDDPLVFYHFSSLDIGNESNISKHKPDTLLSERDDLVGLYSDYRKRVKANGWEKWSRIPYAYNNYSDGGNIELIHRRLYAHIYGACIDPFTIPSGKVYTVIKHEYNKIQKAKQTNYDSFIMKTIKGCLKLLLKVAGAKKYYSLISATKSFNNIKNHEFLLK